MNYSIEEFWKNRISTENTGELSNNILGWSKIPKMMDEYVQAPTTLSKNYSENTRIETANIIMVSAPGAVGKTTLARQIAAVTGAIFVDLAKADPVGANTLAGGLTKLDIYSAFKDGNTAIIIDGLDEARMRVTQGAMAAFIRDVVELAANDRNPIVLLGRTGAIEEAWLLLQDEGVEAPVLEIGYYDNDDVALEFIKKQIQYIRKELHPREPDGRAAKLLLENLQNATYKDGCVFSGYAPVLIAIAQRIADPKEKDNSSKNTQKLISSIEKGEEDLSIDGITDAIMKREQSKLSEIKFDDPSLKDKLYLKEEQLARLVGQIYRIKMDIPLPKMSDADRESYEKILADWLPQHPFLDGKEEKPSSMVFAGLLAAHALNSSHAQKAALKAELERGTAVSPFLAEFYIPLLEENKERPCIPFEHINVIYSSIRARLAIGEYAGLNIDEEENGIGRVEIEINNKVSSGEPELLKFEINLKEIILFGSQVQDVRIEAPQATISIGSGTEVILESVEIEAKSLIIDTNQLVLKHSSQDNPDNQIKLVQLFTNEPIVSELSKPPVVRDGVLLEVRWPGATKAFPWTDYVISGSTLENLDERTVEAIQKLKKFLRLFRARGKKQLGKLKAAVEHSRRTNGVGAPVLNQLVEENILKPSGRMYFLDLDRLAKVTGLTFEDIRSANKEPSQKTVEFVEKALSKNQ